MEDKAFFKVGFYREGSSWVIGKGQNQRTRDEKREEKRNVKKRYLAIIATK